jgi:hypothetical protein
MRAVVSVVGGIAPRVRDAVRLIARHRIRAGRIIAGGGGDVRNARTRLARLHDLYNTCPFTGQCCKSDFYIIHNKQNSILNNVLHFPFDNNIFCNIRKKNFEFIEAYLRI